MAQSTGWTARLRSRFAGLFGNRGDARIALAPGRVNLIGEHTDYNEGFVLPMAIDRHVGVAFAPRTDRTLRLFSVAFEESEQIALDDLASAHGRRWAAYIAGVAWAMCESGLDLTGSDMVVDGDLPLGSGLSSSAALEMATARALCDASGIPWQPRRMARLGQWAENDFVGVRCGIMDQLASAAAEPNCALLVDCRTLDTEAVPFPDDATIVVMDTGSRRSLAASAYNERRSSCQRAVEILRDLEPGVRALRDVNRELLGSARPRFDDITFRRARHVVEENSRPRPLADALRSGELELAGRLMNESHRSLRGLYEVSSPELDRITELARRHPACFGARLTGAGFGGCAVALVAADGAASFADTVGAAYREQVDLPSSLFACRPVGGARLIEPEELEGDRSEVALEG